jgi:hypothetical protein
MNAKGRECTNREAWMLKQVQHDEEREQNPVCAELVEAQSF